MIKGNELSPVAWPVESIDVREERSGTLRDALNIVFRRWKMVVAFFFATFLSVVVIILFFNQTTYSAVAQLVVLPGREHVADMRLSTGGALQPSLDFNAEEQVLRTIEMLTSRFLAEQAVRQIGPAVLYEDLDSERKRFLGTLSAAEAMQAAITRLLKNVTAMPAGKSGLINLSFEHKDPQVAAQVVNVLGDLYVTRHLDVQRNPRGDAVIEEQFGVLKQKLRKAEETLETFKNRYGITGPVKDELELGRKQVLASQMALSDARKLQSEVDSRLTALRGQLDKTSRNPNAVGAVQEKLANLELQESELAQRATAAHPTLRSLRREIAAVRKQLDDVEDSKPYGTVASKEGGLYGRLQEEMLRNETESRALAARIVAEEKNLATHQNRLQTLEKISVEYGHLQQLAELDTQNYRLFLTKMEESRISHAMDAKNIASVRVIDPAEPPSTPVDSKNLLKLALGLIFGGVGGIALAFLMHFISGRVDTIEDVERSLGLPVLASIPELEWKEPRPGVA